MKLRVSTDVISDMLFTEPVVFFFSLWVSFSWAVLYLQFGSIPLVFKTNHHFTTEQTGAVFACRIAFPIFGLLAANFTSDVCWCHNHHDRQHSARQDRQQVWISPQETRGSTVLCLR